MTMRTEYVIGGVLVIALAAGGFLARGMSPAREDTEKGSAEQRTLSVAEKNVRYQKAPELVSPDGYINTHSTRSGQAVPITIGEFKGKNVVLIGIWTYSCINCQRTLPYLKTWHETYGKDGLVIIGVHTPEFAFEKVQANDD